jgi:hypothetical protein
MTVTGYLAHPGICLKLALGNNFKHDICRIPICYIRLLHKEIVTDRHKTYYILLHISLGEARSAYIGQQKVRMLEFLSTNLN